MGILIIQRIFQKFRTVSHRLFITPYYKCILGSMGAESYIPQSARLENPQNIYIGKRVWIGRMSWLAANPITGCLNCTISIGEGSYIGNFAHIYSISKIEIGQNVLMADKVYITDNLHTYSDVQKPIILQPIQQINNVHIGDGAWIGENVCIIGSDIGKQTVIGANSVVTRSIPDYCVAVGAPARIVKRYSFEKKAWLKTDGEGNFTEL